MSNQLKIFSVSKNDWAGCGYFLSEAINACTPHHSRATRKETSGLNFPSDMKALTRQRLRLLWDWADVIHIHDASGFNERQLFPKPVVVTYHGTRYRRGFHRYHSRDRKQGWLGSVATPDLTQYGLPFMPDCRPDLSQYVDRADEFTVIHAPTNRNVKGTQVVIDACKRLGVKLDLIETITWKECMVRKGRGHLLVDQFELGYGCNAIEAWAMGMPVIAAGTPEVFRTLHELFDPVPFLAPDGSALAEAIDRLRLDEDLYRRWTEVGVRHYQTWHSPEAVSEIAVGLYEQAIRFFRMRGVARRPERMRSEGMVLLRYLGTNTGTQRWFPEGNRTPVQYRFSSSKPYKYVYESDVQWLLKQKDKRNRPLFEVIEDG